MSKINKILSLPHGNNLFVCFCDTFVTSILSSSVIILKLIFLHIQGMYYQIGDIVSLVDHDMSVYYAQIRGFMQDQYNEKSAVISWLLPTQGTSQEDYFDPTTYILGR